MTWPHGLCIIGDVLAPFVAPRFDRPLDLEGHVALASHDATVKGFIFADLIAYTSQRLPGVDLMHEAKLRPRRYLPFLDYPLLDWWRLSTTAARLLYPSVAPGEALRRLGQLAFRAFFSTQAGRSMFEFFGVEIDQILLAVPKAYRVLVNFGQVTARRIDDKNLRFRFENYPGFLETYQIGVFEGAMQHMGVSGVVLISLERLDRAEFDLKWA